MFKRPKKPNETINELIEAKWPSGLELGGIDPVEAKLVVPRVPTTIFQFDYAINGGFPLWRVTRLKGPEDGGKSTTALSIMKTLSMFCFGCMQYEEFCTCKNGPYKLRSAYCDIELKFEKAWARSIGVPDEAYYLPHVEKGGHWFDATEALLRSDECGCVILDSLAMIMPSTEYDRSAEQSQPGSQAKMITKGMNILADRFRKEQARDHPCFVVAINQIRKNIGSFTGPTETEGGGHAVRHLVALGVRMVKSKTESKVFKQDGEDFVMAAAYRGRIDKHHIVVNQESFKFLRAVTDIYSKKDEDLLLYPAGTVIDYKHCMEIGIRLGVIRKPDESNPVVYCRGIKWKNRKQLRDMWIRYPQFYYSCQLDILKARRMVKSECRM